MTFITKLFLATGMVAAVALLATCFRKSASPENSIERSNCSTVQAIDTTPDENSHAGPNPQLGNQQRELRSIPWILLRRKPIALVTDLENIPLPGIPAVAGLVRNRTVKVLVVRDEDIYLTEPKSSAARDASGPVLPRRLALTLNLPLGENDVLTALAKTGGVGMDEVIVERSAKESKRRIRIPLMLAKGDSFNFTEEDIILHDGDVLYALGHKEQP